ncbi:uncharacterized protein MYCFIDRAFT_75812 [Pseudocercospora fijiensis CIRAD86]|uniref:SET domain-containing protein n=1 Tax=Pseudocercospora fijiensis (strain CIRAD86) TaxID=383855 RepID=N1QAJ6_PSEFD|nr:uncharacterized protein MYCFIDRAFT_75812 [Pseudocercospora fijiensis CIRAD86]EME87982.1 hypothetical protein MYCFIDRAFT_75812 [Pseudocercospora fijiensis CIRAD86]
MDQPFDCNSWTPSNSWEWEPWLTPYTTIEIRALIKQLNRDTNIIKEHPYEPKHWIKRAKTLTRLRYPELAVGDAHKASLLIQNLLEGLDTRSNSRVGCDLGFWMSDPDIDEDLMEEEHEKQQNSFEATKRDAEDIISSSLCFAPSYLRGQFVPAPYPWLEEKHRMRSDDVIQNTNLDLADPENGASGGITCWLKRYAFGPGVGAREGADLLGVFAARDIDAGSVIVVDRSRIWVVFEALQQFGVDIFSDLNFDTWVIFVLQARLDNNQWSDPNTTCLSSLFALFNHSCEPNVSWTTQGGHQTLEMTTKRRIREGEQLFVEYDSFMNDKPLEERRRRLYRWLDGPCQCSRCAREHSELSRTASPLTSSFGSSEWDTDEKPVLPEDLGVEFERWDSLICWPTIRFPKLVLHERTFRHAAFT